MSSSEMKPDSDNSADQPHKSEGELQVGPISIGSWVLYNFVVPIGLLAIGALAIVLFGQVTPKSRPPADNSREGILRSLPPVEVAKLNALDLDKTPLLLEVDGVVVPFRESMVPAEVAGRIVFKSEKCEAGMFVRKDEVLMRIDSTDYQLDVDQFSKQKEQAYQSLKELDQEVSNARRLLNLAKKDVDLQQAEVDRQMSLPKGFSSRAEIDRAKRSLLTAQQQMQAQQNQLDLLSKRRIRLESSEKLAATQLKQAETNLKRTEIVAPMDGVIVREDAELNAFVARGSPLFSIEDTTKVEVSINLRMDQLYWVQDQQPTDQMQQNDAAQNYSLPKTPAIIEYELTGRGNSFYRWSGHLAGYDGIGLDTNTRTVPVRVVVDAPQRFLDEKGNVVQPNGPSALVRGMYVRVKLKIKPKTPLVVIPAVALKPGNRVWEFIPDESVLQRKETEEASEEPATQPIGEPRAKAKPAEEKDEASVAKEPEFLPNDWRAGRVVVRDAITPINSIQIQQPDGVTADSDQRLWVCEVRDQVFEGGAFVVTSPLAAVEKEGTPARAESAVIGPLDAKQLVSTSTEGER